MLRVKLLGTARAHAPKSVTNSLQLYSATMNENTSRYGGWYTKYQVSVRLLNVLNKIEFPQQPKKTQPGKRLNKKSGINRIRWSNSTQSNRYRRLGGVWSPSDSTSLHDGGCLITKKKKHKAFTRNFFDCLFCMQLYAVWPEYVMRIQMESEHTQKVYRPSMPTDEWIWCTLSAAVCLISRAKWFCDERRRCST